MLKKKMSVLELFGFIIIIIAAITAMILNMNEDSSVDRTDEQELNYRVESWKQNFNNYQNYDNYDDYY